MTIIGLDTKYWPEISKGKSLYIHKLTVKRVIAGKGVSKELINFAPNLSFLLSLLTFKNVVFYLSSCLKSIHSINKELLG